MKESWLLTLARYTRGPLRRKTPVLHGLCRLLLRVVCPRGKGERAHHLIASYAGGRVHVDTSSALEYSLLFRGVHEPEIASWITKSVRPGAVCLDVGANVGAHTLLMARLAGPTGRVLAFEPHPGLCERLRENVALNGYANVTVVEAAVSATDGNATLHTFPEGSFRRGISSLVYDPRTPDAIEVAVVDGRAIETDHGIERYDFVKIDVEGHDAVVLDALADAIQRHRPVVVFEYRRRRWEQARASLPETLERLRASGYAFQHVQKGRSLPLDEDAIPDGCEIVCLPSGD